MEKHTTKILQLVSLVLVFCSLSFAQKSDDSFLLTQGYTTAEIGRFTQNGKDLFPKKALKEKDIDLKIVVSKKEITFGEKIELHISLKNNYTHTFDLPYMNYDYFGGYNVAVKNSKGEIVEPFKDPRENAGFGSRLGVEVNAGKEYKRILLLNGFYELTPGKYSIIINRKVKGWGKAEWVSVKSNAVDLTVIK